jgi:hypothetical protein
MMKAPPEPCAVAVLRLNQIEKIVRQQPVTDKHGEDYYRYQP